MIYFESSKLKIPRRICSCAACGTKDLIIEQLDLAYGLPEYHVAHRGYCKKGYWYTKGYTKVNAAVAKWNAMNEEWLEGFDLIWFEVDRVYETRWDCNIAPEGVRQVA